MTQSISKMKIKELLLASFLYLFILSALFFPFAYRQSNSVYYITFCLPNCILTILFLFYIFAECSFDSPKNISIVGFKILLCVLGGLSFYFAFRYQSWYWDIVNKGISFFLFYFLCEKLPADFIYRYHIIPFTVISLALMASASVYLYYHNIEGIRIGNDLSLDIIHHGGYSDIRLEWLYFHKSIYSLLLLPALAVALRCRKLLFHPILWIACLVGITWALVCTSTVTAIFGMVLIYTGYSISLIPGRKLLKEHPIPVILGGVVFIIVCGIALTYIFLKITASRNLSTLGSRIPIWQASMEAIKQNPRGIGMDFEKVYIYNEANNCHNVFLNEMFRFSIPVGLCYLAVFFYLFLKSGFKQRTFSLGLWTALFMAWGMDYSMRVETMSIMMFLIYLALFFPVCQNSDNRKS